jgi:ABC-type transport system involved in cytochrome c biogenesis permease subunit
VHCFVDSLWITIICLWVSITLPVKPETSPTRHLGTHLACAPPNSHTTSMVSHLLGTLLANSKYHASSAGRLITMMLMWLCGTLARILLGQDPCQHIAMMPVWLCAGISMMLIRLLYDRTGRLLHRSIPQFRYHPSRPGRGPHRPQAFIVAYPFVPLCLKIFF